MKKALAYLGMPAIVVLLLVADAAAIAKSSALSRLARERLKELFGDQLDARDIHVALPGTLTLEAVTVSTESRFKVFDARRVEIRLREGLSTDVKRVTFEDARLTLSGKLFEELAKGGEKKKTVREVFPDPEAIPQVIVRGGTLEADLPAALSAPQAMAIRELTMTRVDGYRCHVSGRLESPLLGAWTADGVVDLDSGLLRVTLRCEGFRMGPALREAGGPDVRLALDRYGPNGLCDLTVTLRQDPGADLDFMVLFSARDMDFLYANFPYPVDHVNGEIEFYRKGFYIKNMRGRHGPATVRFDGTASDYPKDSALSFRIEIDDLPLDPMVRAALEPDAQRVWDLFTPAGTIQVRGRAIQAAGSTDARIPLDISLRGASFKFRDFPYEVKDAVGDLRVETPDLRIKRLTSRQGDTVIDLCGDIRDITSEAEIDLTIEAQGLKLDDRLRDALPAAPRQLWDEYAPTAGAVDTRWRVRKTRGKDAVHTSFSRLRDVKLTWKEIPLPMSEVEGEVEMEPGLVRLHHVHGKTRGAAVELQGEVAGEVSTFHVDATGLPLDPAVKDALPPSLSGLLKDLRLGGLVNFRSTVKLLKDDKKTVDLDLKLSQGVIDTEPKFTDLLGSVSLTGGYDKEPYFTGFMTFQQLAVAGKKVTDLSASFTGSGTQINFRKIKATAYDGILSSGGFSVDTKTGDFAGDFVLDRLDIAKYSLDTGFAGKALSGRLSLEIHDLAGNAQRPDQIAGKGKLQVREALLWDVPLFTNLFVFNVGGLFTTKKNFDAGTVEFDIKERKFRISSMAFTSKTVSLAGSGRVNFDGDMHLRLKVKSGPLFGINFFITDWAGDILSFITGALVGVDVAGPFDNPKVSADPLPGFK